MRRFYPYLLTLFCLVFLMGCKLTITAFNAPDTANTGSVIPLILSCTATNITDGASLVGVVVQIPAGWSVLYAKVNAQGGTFDLTEDPVIAGLYTAEPGQVIWAGKIAPLSSGSEGMNVAFTINVLTGNFSGSPGQTQIFNLKAVVGATREGVWIADDPENVLNFAAVTGEQYKQSITVTQVEDNTAPDPITNPVAEIYYYYNKLNTPANTTAVKVAWEGYDEATQGDVVNYRVYRSTSAFSDVSGMTPIIEISIGHLYFYDYSITPDTGYYYAITAVDELSHENLVVSTAYIYVHFPGSITGTVYNTDELTAITMKNIQIRAYTGSCNISGKVGETTVDQATGVYTITGLLPGTYYLQTASNENFISEWWASPDSVRDCTTAQSITIGEGQDVTGKHFQLDPGGTISGQLYESNGTSITERITITAYTGSPCDNHTWVGQVESGAFFFMSVYTITGLPPGSYFLQTASNESHISEWWASPASTWRCSGAQVIEVVGLDNITGKDFQLNRSDSILKGDINGDGNVDLSDLIETLQILTGKNIEVMPGTDVNQNEKTGMEEAIYILQVVSGIRP